ncbi:histone-like nucleoid-structuring protein Lsr2 [Streptomonospora litoralis]|uniref:Nucleoid-associated protein Lsr2 n=1 Tax=Streptomonospora litoralis TaxID=2498135 RepID=A0A4P6Q7Q4_9ACTN|nr:Lsr2 family protein [Streptomonospora litoralis]QBI56420.1 Nucleoid-associated protein Lsr2 [Streptomonospora litoralis]
MAQQVQVLLVDDMQGGTAEETVPFSIDGTSYEIDLNAENAEELRAAIMPFVESARKVRSAKSTGNRRRNRPSQNRQRTADIRAWAKQQGKEVNDRGRIPASIVAEYEAAH